MASPSSDRELVAAARAATGAQHQGRIDDADLYAELDAIKQQVTDEVQVALNSGTIALYDSDAPLEMAQHLLYLQTADKRRQQGQSGEKVPEKPVPKSIGELQRTSFNDPTLNHWRNRAVAAYQRFTDN